MSLTSRSDLRIHADLSDTHHDTVNAPRPTQLLGIFGHHHPEIWGLALRRILVGDTTSSLDACDVPFSLRTHALSAQLEASGNAVRFQVSPALTCETSMIAWISYGPESLLWGLAVVALFVYLVFSYRWISTRRTAPASQSS